MYSTRATSAVSRPPRPKFGAKTDHSDPSGLYSYRRQPERVLFALDKLANALSPLVGYEQTEGAPSKGFSEGKSSDDVQGWIKAAQEPLVDWQDIFWDVEREVERKGWQSVSRLFLPNLK